jgi:hypothetical protein
MKQPKHWVVLFAAVSLSAAAACGGIDEGDASTLRPFSGATSMSDPGQPPQAATAASTGDGINTTGAGAGTGAATGLPCDVQQLFENRCIGCHLGASPPKLLTYDDLMKPAPSNPAVNLAKASLDRIKDAARPMPPAPAELPTATEVGTLQAWVNAGTPRGAACTTAPPAGAPAAGATNPYATPSVCTSGTTTVGRQGSTMRPGEACITCHSMKGGPSYQIAGTVYPTAHEPNDCNGVNGGVTVVVTDAKGVVTQIPVNSVGNFSSRATIAAPFHVKVTSGTKERVMAGSLTAGDCNSCHMENGANGAPGRIMAP